jgi:hypothetical protein
MRNLFDDLAIQNSSQSHEHFRCTCRAPAGTIAHAIAVLAEVSRRQRYMQRHGGHRFTCSFCNERQHKVHLRLRVCRSESPVRRHHLVDAGELRKVVFSFGLGGPEKRVYRESNQNWNYLRLRQGKGIGPEMPLRRRACEAPLRTPPRAATSSGDQY